MKHKIYSNNFRIVFRLAKSKIFKKTIIAFGVTECVIFRQQKKKIHIFLTVIWRRNFPEAKGAKRLEIRLAEDCKGIK